MWSRGHRLSSNMPLPFLVRRYKVKPTWHESWLYISFITLSQVIYLSCVETVRLIARLPNKDQKYPNVSSHLLIIKSPETSVLINICFYLNCRSVQRVCDILRRRKLTILNNNLLCFISRDIGCRRQMVQLIFRLSKQHTIMQSTNHYAIKVMSNVDQFKVDSACTHKHVYILVSFDDKWVSTACLWCLLATKLKISNTNSLFFISRDIVCRRQCLWSKDIATR